MTSAQSKHLDSWRGWSALAVVADHAVQTYSDRLSPAWQAIGGAAVMVFFVLSGFFIHKSLVRTCTAGHPRDFVVARVNRILPPFLLAIALTVALWALAPWAFVGGDRHLNSPFRSEYSLDGLVVTATFLNGFAGRTLSANGPLWSLSYEVWYYILAFLISQATGRGGWLFAVAFAVVLAVLTGCDLRFFALGSVWVLGFFVSVLHSNGRLPALSHWPFSALPSAMMLWLSLRIPGTTKEEVFYAFDIALGVWFAIYLAQVIQRDPRAFAPSTATFSYTLYVTHFPLLLFFYGSGVPVWVALPVALFLAIVVGPWVEAIKLLSVRRPRLAAVIGHKHRLTRL